MIRICDYVRIRARYVGQNLGANVLHSAFTGQSSESPSIMTTEVRSHIVE